MLLKIVIQNPDSETVINNVGVEELGFWYELLDGAVHGQIKVYDAESGLEYRPSQQVA
jgi:hypothetical protein